MGVCKTKHPEPVLNDDAHADPLGFLIVYVDDILCVGPRPVVEASLGRIRDEWTCSEVEWVNSTKWLKFCGMQLGWQGDSLLLGQPDFARELLERHGPVPGRQVPLPKIDMVPDVEESIDPADVRKCQQLLGELLWLRGRTRPDLAFAVSTLSGWVTKCPKKVQELGRYLLGYLQETWEFVLVYKSCLTDQGEPTDELMKLTLLSDASHAPQGLRGCQGILALWGGALVQWESKRQPFAALSSTEAELIGYVDALTIGESLQVILNILEHNALVDDGQFEIRGDNLSGIQLLLAPDGPWRTRHLRLRSFVLRERLASREWHVEHVPGAELAADLLTKPVVLLNHWESFRRTLGLIKFSMPDETSRLCRLAEAVVALGGLVLQNGASQLVKTAGAISLSALTAWMCCHEGLASIANTKKENSEPRPAQEKEKSLREHEPRPVKGDARENEPALQHEVRDHEPTSFYCSPKGSPAAPRLCAVRAPSLGPTPWESVEFNQPPCAANDDLWISLNGGWERAVQEDQWFHGQVPPQLPVTGQWRGWTFFRLEESPQNGHNSSSVTRIQPDVLVWTPDNERAWNMPRQLGRSSGSGRRAQVDAIGRGAAAFASMGTGQVSRETSSVGSWSVAGSYRGPPLSTPSASSMAPVMRPMGSVEGSSSSSASWGPTRSSLRRTVFPPGTQVYQRSPAPVNRWNDGPTLSVREGESVREATLRVLQAPLPPDLHPGRPREDPTGRRTRYLRSNRSDVSDGMLWDFLHGTTVEGGTDDGQYYEEAVESEEETSDGSFSVVTDQPQHADVPNPEDEVADM